MRYTRGRDKRIPTRYHRSSRSWEAIYPECWHLKEHLCSDSSGYQVTLDTHPEIDYLLPTAVGTEISGNETEQLTICKSLEVKQEDWSISLISWYYIPLCGRAQDLLKHMEMLWRESTGQCMIQSSRLSHLASLDSLGHSKRLSSSVEWRSVYLKLFDPPVRMDDENACRRDKLLDIEKYTCSRNVGSSTNSFILRPANPRKWSHGKFRQTICLLASHV